MGILGPGGSGIEADSTDTLTNKTIDANGAGNSISNIDVEDLANGTDGELITWDAAGVPAVVPVGTATNVLTSNGAGAAPTFQAAAGGGGGAWSLISSATASASATVDFTGLSSDYIQYKVVMSGIVPATDQVLWMRTSTDNGSTYDTAYISRVEVYDHNGTKSGTGSFSETKILLTQVAVDALATDGGYSGEVRVFDPSNASFKTQVMHDGLQYIAGGTVKKNRGFGIRTAQEDVDAIRFLFASGNIASGTFHLYGLTAT